MLAMKQVKPTRVPVAMLFEDPHVPSPMEVSGRNAAEPDEFEKCEKEELQLQSLQLRKKREERQNKEERALRTLFEVDDFPEELVNQPLGRKRPGCFSVGLFSRMICSPEKLWPLHVAAKAQSLPAVRLLLKMKADPKQRSSHGRTALAMLLDKPQKESHLYPDNLNQLRLLLSEKLVIQTVSTGLKPHSQQLPSEETGKPFVAGTAEPGAVRASDLELETM